MEAILYVDALRMRKDSVSLIAMAVVSGVLIPFLFSQHQNFRIIPGEQLSPLTSMGTDAVLLLHYVVRLGLYIDMHDGLHQGNN